MPPLFFNLHTGKYLVNMYNKNCRSRNISRNWSSLKIFNHEFLAGQSWNDSLSLLSESLWSCPSSLNVLMPAFVHLMCSSTLKINTFRACMDQLSGNFTNILKLLQTFRRIISRLGIKWLHDINESLFLPRKHLNISTTLCLAGTTLLRCWHQIWKGEGEG